MGTVQYRPPTRKVYKAVLNQIFLFQKDIRKMSAAIDKCPHYNSGFCKFTQKCKLFHPTEICEQKCKDKACQKRHPKLCKKGAKCSFLGMGECAYSHLDMNKEQKVSNNELKDLVLNLSSKVESLTESINAKDKEISVLKLKFDALEKKTMDLKEQDLDETLNENDWKESMNKVQNLEKNVVILQELSEKNKQTFKYNTIGISDTDKVVNNLIDVVKEHDQIILKLEEKEKEKEELSSKVKEKINVITKVSGLLLRSHFKDLIPKLGITQDQIPTSFNGYNFDL